MFDVPQSGFMVFRSDSIVDVKSQTGSNDSQNDSKTQDSSSASKVGRLHLILLLTNRQTDKTRVLHKVAHKVALFIQQAPLAASDHRKVDAPDLCNSSAPDDEHMARFPQGAAHRLQAPEVKAALTFDF